MDNVTGKEWSNLPLEKKKESLKTTISESRDLLNEFEEAVDNLNHDSKIETISIDLITTIDLPKNPLDKNGITHIENCVSGDIEGHFYALCMLAEDLAKDYEMSIDDF